MYFSLYKYKKHQNMNIFKNETETVYIEITEGCTYYSYTINGIEWVDLTDPKSPDYTLNHNNIVERVFDALYIDINTQYNIPSFLRGYMLDNEADDFNEVPFTQQMFCYMVEAHKDTKSECLGHCDECGDTIWRYTLKLKVDKISK